MVVVISEPTHPRAWIPALAFHPTLPLLATAGSEPDTPDDKQCRLIHLWELDYDVLLGKKRAGGAAAVRTVHLLRGLVYADFRDESAYFTTASDLILSLYQLPLTHPAIADLRESLRGPEMR